MMVAPLLHPGPRHPYAPMSWRALAAFVHVPVAEIRQWVDDGLPQVADGLIDPFACANWLCWGRLDRCPTLARRWRGYLVFFAPFLADQDRPRRLHWRRTQRLYLPAPAARIQWWLARPVVHAAQAVEHGPAPTLDGCTTTREDEWWQLAGTSAADEPTVVFSAQVDLAPQRVLSHGSDEHRELALLVEQVAGTFRYEYRHHQPWEYGEALAGGRIQARVDGSCLDCAMALGAVLQERGRPWRLLAGVVADSRIANPHFWLETRTTGGVWAPLDPTLPAIVRMVGGDWRAAARAWTGACDARRVTLGVVAAGVPGLPGGPTVGSLMGEALVDGRNAWPCMDWVCGDCESAFNEIA